MSKKGMDPQVLARVAGERIAGIRADYESFKFLKNGEKTMAREKYVTGAEHIANIEKTIEAVYAEAENQHRELTSIEKKKIQELDQHIAELTATDPPKTVAGMRLTNRSAGSPFSSLGEQLSAIMKAEIPGQRPDDRLYQIQNAASGLGETVPSDGGFLLQSDFSTALLEKVFSESPLASRCTTYEIGSNANSIKIPSVDETSRADGSRQGGVLGYWLAEADEKTGTKPKFRSMELSLKKVACLVYTTDELLEDSSVLGKYVSEAMAAELTFQVENAIMNGSGAGQPLGILNSSALVAVDKEDGQAGSSLIYENILSMYSRLPGRNRARGVWFINQSIEPQLYTMSLAVGTGGNGVYTPAAGASVNPYSTLLGMPVIPIEHCAALGTVGDIVLCDPSAYILARKGGIKTDMSIHVRFNFDESIFRAVLRIDGMPAWSAPLTPFDGGNDLSPFIALESR